MLEIENKRSEVETISKEVEIEEKLIISWKVEC